MALSDEDRAALSAYLDGELDDEATHRIEVRLTSDPALRFEYETLRHTWSLLDFLPRATPSLQFTNRTLARLTLEKQAGASTWISRVWRRVPPATVGWAAALMFAMGVGVLLGGWLTEPGNADAMAGLDETLVRHLRVIERWPLYRHAPTVDFLSQLDHPDLFGDEAGFGALAVPPMPPQGVAEPAAEEQLTAHRAQLEKWREQPEQLARMRRDVQIFLALPEEHRNNIEKLDADLQRLPKLVNVLERYVHWLERLPANDRETIEKLDNIPARRLAYIQGLRDQDWVESQPRAVRDQIKSLPPNAQQDRVSELRKDEQQRRADWAHAARFWNRLNDGKAPPPLSRGHLSAWDQEGVYEFLMMFLSPQEKGRLQKAEGLWPDYVTTLVELADKHPFALPSPDGPRIVEELPQALRVRFKERATPSNPPVIEMLRTETQDKRWPAMGLAVVKYSLQLWKRGPLPRELWACNFKSLGEPMQIYVKKHLEGKMPSKDWEQVVKADNKWPDYPLAIQKLAEKHKLPAPPWETALGGPREQWDDFRTVRAADQPLQVPQQVLQDFMMFKLKPDERAKLKFSPLDPQSWKRVEARYQEHLRELSKLVPTNTKKFGTGHFPIPVRDRDRKGFRD